MKAASFSAGHRVRQSGPGISKRSRTDELAAAVSVASLMFLPLSTLAQEKDLPPAQAEFMELLEYLGSWDGPEEDWVLLPGDTADPGSAPFDIEIAQPTREALAGAL